MGIVTDILVIGAGPTGLHAVFQAGLLGLKCHVVDSLYEVGGSRIKTNPNRRLYNLPGIPVQTTKEHVDILVQQASVFDPVYHMQERAISLSTFGDSHEVITNTGKIFHARNVILATGDDCFIPRTPTVQGTAAIVESGRLHNTITDLNKFAGKDVMVLGGGRLATEHTHALSKIAKTVKMVHKYSLSPKDSSAISELLDMHDDADSNISVVCNCELTSIGPNSIKAYCSKTKKILETTFDDIFCFYGKRQTRSPVLKWDIETHLNKIAVNTKSFETNKKGIFAVGKCCNYPKKINTLLTGYSEAAMAVQEAYKRCMGEIAEPVDNSKNKKLQRKFNESTI